MPSAAVTNSRTRAGRWAFFFWSWRELKPLPAIWHYERVQRLCRVAAPITPHGHHRDEVMCCRRGCFSGAKYQILITSGGVGVGVWTQRLGLTAVRMARLINMGYWWMFGKLWISRSLSPHLPFLSLHWQSHTSEFFTAREFHPARSHI